MSPSPLVHRLAELLAAGDARAVVQLGRHDVGPDDRHSHYVIGLALQRLGRWGEAIASYRSAGSVAAGAGEVAHAELLLHGLRDVRGARAAAEDAHGDGAWGAAGLLAHIADRHLEDETAAEHWATAAVAEGDGFGHWVLAGLHADRDEGVLADLELRRALEEGYQGNFHRLGWILDKAGRSTEAEAAYRESIAREQGPPYNELGMLLARQRGREAEAEAAYRAAIDGGDVNAPNNLGRLLVEAGRDDEAEVLFRQAIDLGQPHADNNLANLLLRRGDTDEAEHHFKRAVALGEAAGLNSYAVLLNSQGRMQERDDMLVQAARGGNAIAHFNLGVFAERDGRFEDAEHHYRDAIELPSEQQALQHRALGNLLIQQLDRFEEGVRQLELAADGGETEAHANLATHFEREHRLDDAERHRRLAVEVGGHDARMRLVRFLQRHGRGSECEGLLRDVVLEDPTNTDALNDLAVIFYKRGHLDRAVELWERAVRLEGRLATLNLGRFHLTQGRHDEAKVLLHPLDEDGVGPATLLLAHIAKAQGASPAELEAILRRAFERGEPCEAALAGELAKLRPWDPEIDVLRQRVIEREDSAHARRRYADYLLGQGRVADAVEQLEAATLLDADPAIAEDLRMARVRLEDDSPS